MVYSQPLSTLTFKVTFQPVLSILHSHTARDIGLPTSYTVFRQCLEAQWVMHDAAILVSRTVWVFNQPGSAEFYCLATAIPVTMSTSIRRALERQSKQDNYYSPFARCFWGAWGATGCSDAFLTNSPMRKQWVQLGETNKSMAPFIQQLLIRHYLLHSPSQPKLGGRVLQEGCCKTLGGKRMQEVTGNGTQANQAATSNPDAALDTPSFRNLPSLGSAAAHIYSRR